MENVFGIVSGDMTSALMDGYRQAKSFGTTIIDSNIISAAPDGERFAITVESGEVIHTKAVVLATGVSRTKLGVPGEKELFGKGVSYCASCDCNFYKGKKAVIVGAQSEAAVSAELMTHYASETYWAVTEPSADPKLVDAALSAGAEILNSSVKEIRGKDRVESVLLQDGREISVDGVFIELGGRSSANIALDLGVMPEIDDTVKVGRDCSTEVPGVFACGDITGRPWQVAKAIGEGCIAGLQA